jgi:hypothetical protein
VVAILVGISAVPYLNKAPLWARIILCVLVLIMLIRNSSFAMTTAFFPAHQIIRTQHRKLFGVKERTVHFTSVSKVDFEVEHQDSTGDAARQAPVRDFLLEVQQTLRAVRNEQA